MTPMTLKMEGPWHKGNLHLHTNRSDGRLALAAVAEKYAAPASWDRATGANGSITRMASAGRNFGCQRTGEIEDTRGKKAWTNPLGSMQAA